MNKLTIHPALSPIIDVIWKDKSRYSKELEFKMEKDIPKDLLKALTDDWGLYCMIEEGVSDHLLESRTKNEFARRFCESLTNGLVSTSKR